MTALLQQGSGAIFVKRDLKDLSTKVMAKTSKSYLTGVRSFHVDLRYDNLSVFHHPQLRRIIAATRRMRVEAET